MVDNRNFHNGGGPYPHFWNAESYRQWLYRADFQLQRFLQLGWNGNGFWLCVNQRNRIGDCDKFGAGDFLNRDG
jgi:hypothetical protein